MAISGRWLRGARQSGCAGTGSAALEDGVLEVVLLAGGLADHAGDAPGRDHVAFQAEAGEVFARSDDQVLDPAVVEDGGDAEGWREVALVDGFGRDRGPGRLAVRFGDGWGFGHAGAEDVGVDEGHDL